MSQALKLHTQESSQGWLNTQLESNKLVVFLCKTHGEITRNDIAKAGLSELVCPTCYEAKRATAEKNKRMAEALEVFKNTSGIPARFQSSSFENYTNSEKSNKVMRSLRVYCKEFENHKAKGLSLILCGKTGTGKTHLSCAVLREVAVTFGSTVKYATAYNAIQAVRASYKSNSITESQALQEFIKPDLLVIDEIGIQLGTDSEQLILFNLLNGRYEELKPTLVVSNLSTKEITSYLGDRVFDRLRENGGGVLSFDWESWRVRQ